MGIAFRADDIFDIAVQIERNGEEFYERALERLGPGGLRDCFARLAAEESGHAATFRELKADCGEKGYPPAGAEDTAASYLAACARGHLFDSVSDPAARLSELRTPVDVLKQAIVAEKDSIALYTGIKAFIADDQCGREKIDRVIAEEMTHIAQLSEWLEKTGAGDE